ncbi:hypothetical protein CA264_20295 [Pontibacter actiniarum]|uniref:Nucleotidyltransferase n=2 Tax=Pontibacter actiniarum TaxID=323450 RepID=A0A1X9YYI6_9BACT|nr:hypothetical protein CA264_20295 [Pontibacter actiniarum]
MILHLNKQLFRQAAQFTAQQMGIPDIYVEKDYWVTFALHTIFHHAIGTDTVFKGGTALSKCYHLIERFSEDIDLAVLRREGESNNRLTTKIRTISEVVGTALPEVSIERLTHKMGMNRKTAHSYGKEFQGTYGQVRDAIVVEATWLGHFEPHTTRKVNSFVGDMMLRNEQGALAEENGLMPFEVRALEPTRTICEKIMSLVRFSYGEYPLENLKQKIRHTYDLHVLLGQEEFTAFLNSDNFDKMLLKVGQDDVISFRNNNSWLRHHPLEAFIFSELENVWEELKPTFNGSFKNLVYGTLPADTAIFATLIKIRERLSNVVWAIELDDRPSVA